MLGLCHDKIIGQRSIFTNIFIHAALTNTNTKVVNLNYSKQKFEVQRSSYHTKSNCECIKRYNGKSNVGTDSNPYKFTNHMSYYNKQ